MLSFFWDKDFNSDSTPASDPKSALITYIFFKDLRIYFLIVENIIFK